MVVPVLDGTGSTYLELFDDDAFHNSARLSARKYISLVIIVPLVMIVPLTLLSLLSSLSFLLSLSLLWPLCLLSLSLDLRSCLSIWFPS